MKNESWGNEKQKKIALSAIKTHTQTANRLKTVKTKRTAAAAEHD